ncbi:Uncharacterized protein dnm_062370 [Desulfonema magnum]|uniref:Uncharacterized protein n=1 Tax=Desulfonema magnum TaxID=45655 RepID=A0A975GQL9_9BACT|nr:Uncharacterized protein dnm_062370 [Desulfonema magnum]
MFLVTWPYLLFQLYFDTMECRFFDPIRQDPLSFLRKQE